MNAIIAGSDLSSGSSISSSSYSSASINHPGPSIIAGPGALSSGKKPSCILCLAQLPSTGQMGSPADGVSFNAPNTAIVAGNTRGYVTAFNAYDGRLVFRRQVHTHDVCNVSVRAVPVPVPVVRDMRDVRDVTGVTGVTDVMESHSLQLLTSSYDNTAALWGIKPDYNSYSYNSDDFELPNIATLSGGHSDKVLSATFINPPLSAPTSTSVVTTGADGKVIHWEI